MMIVKAIKILFIICCFICLYYPGKVSAQEHVRVSNLAGLSQEDIDTLIAKTIHNAFQHPDSALMLLRKIRQHCEVIQYDKGIAQALFSIAVIYTENKQLPGTGITIFRESYRAYEKVRDKDRQWITNWFTNMGASFYLDGVTDSAIYYYKQSLKHALNNPVRSNATMLITYQNLGTLLLNMHQYKKARYYLRQAEKVGMQEGDKAMLVGTYQNMAGSYAYEKKFDSTWFYLRKVDSLGIVLSSREAELQHQLAGMVYYFSGKAKEAIQQNKLALSVAPESNIKANHLNNLGASLILNQDYLQARKFLLQSLQEALKHDMPRKRKSLMADIYSNLANVYDSLQDYQQAYHFRTLSTTTADSVHQVEKSEVINRLETQYRTAEKDKQIAESRVRLLAANQQTRNRTTWLIAIGGGTLLLSLTFITLLQRQRLRLQKSRTREQQLKVSHLEAAVEGEEKERSRIGRQLHDEVMVEFSIVRMNMAALPEQDRYVRQLPVYHEMSRQLDIACLKLRQAAHNLMPDALLEEGLLPAINYFCNNIQASSGLRVTFQHYGQLPELPVDKAVSLYRIVQELIQNVIKHAAASQILVQVSYRDGQMDLTVEDNGKGFVNADPTRDGMGLKSIRMRLQALKGSMEIRPVKPQGTSVHIEVDAGM